MSGKKKHSSEITEQMRSLRQPPEAPKEQKKPKKDRTLGQKIIRTVIIVLIVIVGLAAILLADLTIKEYKPADVEEVAVKGEAKPSELTGRTTVAAGDTVNVMSWNVGYAALGDNAEYFTEGGKAGRPSSEDRVKENMIGIAEGIKMVHPNVVFLQDVDTNSLRSYGIDEEENIKSLLNDNGDMDYVSTFAVDHKVDLIPYPIPPVGKVNSGIMTLSDFEVSSSTRHQLTNAYSWPASTVKPKRCFMVDRVAVVDESGNATGKELVLVNLHLEAYDSEEDRAAQTKQLKEFLQQEADKGNYVIAGGDFNQRFSSVSNTFIEFDDAWKCGTIDAAEFGDDFELIMDNSTASRRYLDMSYADTEKELVQYYLTDGFIISKNVEINFYFTIGLEFENTNHNPVVLSVTLN